MTPEEMIASLQLAPYERGGRKMTGADCWGIVELWYRFLLKIILKDRADIKPGSKGLQAGFDAATVWIEIEKPENHCLVIMSANGLQAGHVGIFYNGWVLHSDKSHGCICQPLDHRFVACRITKFLHHTDIKSQVSS